MPENPIILAALGAAVLISILALAALNRLLGGWTPAALEDLDAAGVRLAEDVVDFDPGEGVLAADGRAALVLDSEGARCGLVLAKGGRTVTRVLGSGGLVAAEREGAALRLRLDDFTLPRAQVIMGDETEAQAWLERLRGFVKEA